MYIDIHTHLLPGIDDGLKDESLLPKMFRAYAQCFITSLVFTPHLFNPYVHTDIPNIMHTYENCKAIAEDLGITCYLGSEIFVKDSEKDIQGIPIGNQFYLIEFPVLFPPNFIIQKIKMVQDKGYRVIIAHVERFPWLTWNGDLFKQLQDMGVIFQCNAEDINLPKTKEYLDRDLIDVFASDNHGNLEAPVQLVMAYAKYPLVAQKAQDLGL
ncbi:MAG: hypothetical protein LKE40_00090 [Spirochaetia bacterium]|jgi:protein-tyrosine phosphatase|nr:hypothetical protein [Spirochaetia bacterium]